MSQSEYLSHVPQGVAYADGKFMPLAELQFSIADLGIIHGDATYDVCHVKDGRFFRLNWHLERFRNSARGLRLEIPYDDEDLTEIYRVCVKRGKFRDAFVWMGVTRGIPRSGNPRDLDSCDNRFFAYAKGYYDLAQEVQRGVDITISSVQRIPPETVDPRLKNFNWLDLTRAQFEAIDQGVDTTVLVDKDGNVTEGPGFNICTVSDGQVLTPDGTVLEGVTRRAIGEICKEAGIPFCFASIAPASLRGADEVFLTSTAGGITPVLQVDRIEIGSGEVGVITRTLQETYWQKHKDPSWTTLV